MGNFIPVTGMYDQWTRSCDEPTPHGKGRETSCRQMNDYAKWMKDNRLHVLSYFNVTEFGKDMPWPIPARKAKLDTDLWKDPADFFYHGGLASGVLMDGGKPLYSNCYGAVIVDPGDPAYQKHILEQVRRNTELLSNTDGICIDRTDWMTEYNPGADDAASRIGGARPFAFPVVAEPDGQNVPDAAPVRQGRIRQHVCASLGSDGQAGRVVL